jgi:glutamine synthetase
LRSSIATDALIVANGTPCRGAPRSPEQRSLRAVQGRIADPRGDCNPYLALAATIAAGLHGIEHRLDPGPEFRGKAFGEDVHFHLVNTARQEWAASNRVVTDWELRRSFELA